MFRSLRDRLKKSIGALAKKVEEETPEERAAVEESKELVEEKLKHAEPVEEAPKPKEEPVAGDEEKTTAPVIKEKQKKKGLLGKIFKKKEAETPEAAHHHVELPPKEKEQVKKRVISITKKDIKEEELDEVLWDLQVGLLESDVALETAEKICASIKQKLSGEIASRGKVEDLINDSFRDAVADVLQQEEVDLF